MALFTIPASRPMPMLASSKEVDDKVEVREAPGKGRGVFATRVIECGELIERTVVLVFSARELELLHQTKLDEYLFYWPVDAVVDEGLPLGRVAMANHAEQPNTEYRRHQDEGIIDWVALRRIEPGEELTFKYRCELWFSPR